jgi:hypothetical protein
MAQKLRTNPPPGTYHSMKLVAGSGGVTAGDWIKVNDVIGYVFNTAAEGAEYVLVYVCEKIMAPKITGAGSAFGAGDHVYFDATLMTVTPIQAGGLWRIGVATEAADDDDEEVEIDLEGKAPLVEV